MMNARQFTSLACMSVLMAAHACTHVLHVIPKRALPQLCDAAPHGGSTISSTSRLPQAMCRSCAPQQKKKEEEKRGGGERGGAHAGEITRAPTELLKMYRAVSHSLGLDAHLAQVLLHELQHACCVCIQQRNRAQRL